MQPAALVRGLRRVALAMGVRIFEHTRVTGFSRARPVVLRAGRATLTAQSEEPPYKYVSVEGPVTIDGDAVDVLELASRYLGDELGRWYADANPPTADTVTVRLRPEHWRTFDFAKVLA